MLPSSELRVEARNAGARILLIDDDPAIRRDVSAFLRGHGHRVTEVANGVEALDALGRCPAVTVILLDLRMPVMNGWEFLDQRAADPALATIPVVVISGDPTGVASASVAAIVPKPIALDDLLEEVERARAGP